MLLMEFSAFYIFNTFEHRFTFISPETYILSKDQIDDAKRIFNKELGWGNYQSRHQAEYREDFIANFGDSYTYGEQVTAEQTWSFLLQQKINRNVLNFGTGGFGPAQSLLKFEALKSTLKVKIVILSLTSEMLKRAVNNYRPFYFPGTGIKLTKPRFQLKSGELILEKNPILNEDELINLSNPSFISSIGKNDFWYQLDGLPKKQFPYSKLLINHHFWDEVRNGKADDMNSQSYEIWNDQQAISLFESIINRFIETTKDKFTPVLMFIPRQEDIVNLRDHQYISYKIAFDSVCKNSKLYCIDLTQLSYPLFRDQEMSQFYQNHPTAKLHTHFASTIYEQLSKFGLLND